VTLFCATGSRPPSFTGNAAAASILRRVAVAYLDHPRPLAFAHRGGAGHQPENSWRAFEYAVRLGYAYLETDTRSTADGKLIAFHDAQLDRVTDRTGPVSKLTWKEISAARINGTDEIPLLEDLIGSFPELRFNIDLKDEGTIAPLASVLRRTGAWDRVCVASFSGARLLAAQRSLDRPVCLAVTPAAIVAMRCLGAAGLRAARRLASSGARCAQVPRQIATRDFIRRAHAVGLDVHVWTLNSREEIERALDLGADGVMTDDVVLLRDILAERGRWYPRLPRVAA
jgi:glycerophosphoryl diester phosphodiesterase